MRIVYEIKAPKELQCVRSPRRDESTDMQQGLIGSGRDLDLRSNLKYTILVKLYIIHPVVMREGRFRNTSVIFRFVAPGG